MDGNTRCTIFNIVTYHCGPQIKSELSITFKQYQNHCIFLNTQTKLLFLIIVYPEIHTMLEHGGNSLHIFEVN